MSTVAVIPARYGSTRFPGKLLVPLAGRPLIWHVASRLLHCQVPDRVVLATDDVRIKDAVGDLALEVVIDKGPHRCGSDRVAAAARGLGLGATEQVLNVQGDEPLVDDEALGGALLALKWGRIGTVASRCDVHGSPAPNQVEVLISPVGRALDFRRRSAGQTRLQPSHIGIYAFSGASLFEFSQLPISARETAEGLEQLRALHAGWPIGVQYVQMPAVSINVPQDIKAAQRFL